MSMDTFRTSENCLTGRCNFWSSSFFSSSSWKVSWFLLQLSSATHSGGEKVRVHFAFGGFLDVEFYLYHRSTMKVLKIDASLPQSSEKQMRVNVASLKSAIFLWVCLRTSSRVADAGDKAALFLERFCFLGLKKKQTKKKNGESQTCFGLLEKPSLLLPPSVCGTI